LIYARARDPGDQRLLALTPGIDDAEHPDNRADRVKFFEAGFLGIGVALGREQNESVVPGVGEGGERFAATDREGHRDARLHHHISHRNQRKYGGNGDYFVARAADLMLAAGTGLARVVGRLP